MIRISKLMQRLDKEWKVQDRKRIGAMRMKQK